MGVVPNIGLLAHGIWMAGSYHPRSLLILDADQKIAALHPFVQETPFSTFYDGLLLVLPQHYDRELLSKIRVSSSGLTFEMLFAQLTSEPSYSKVAQHMPCAVYQLSPVDWQHHCLLPETYIKRVV